MITQPTNKIVNLKRILKIKKLERISKTTLKHTLIYLMVLSIATLQFIGNFFVFLPNQAGAADTIPPLSSTPVVSTGLSYYKINLSFSFHDIDAQNSTTTASGLASYQLSNNGSTWSSEIAITQPYVNGTTINYTNWDLTAYGGSNTSGVKTIYIRAKDNDGNIAATQSIITQTAKADFDAGTVGGQATTSINHVYLSPPGVSRLTGDAVVQTAIGGSHDPHLDVAYLDNGNFVTVYDGSSISATFQLYDSSATKIGTATSTGTANSSDPSVSAINNGFVVSSVNSFRLFDNSGNALTSSTPFSIAAIGAQTASTSDGGFIACYKGGTNRVYLEKFDSSGATSSMPWDLKEGSSVVYSYKVYCSASHDNSFYVAVWSDNRTASKYMPYAQIVSSAGATSSPNFRIDQDGANTGTGMYQTARAGINSSNEILFVWYDGREKAQDDWPTRLYGRIYNSDGTAKTNEFIIASDIGDDNGGGGYNYIYSPPGIISMGDRFFVSFSDKDNSSGTTHNRHIKGQVVNNDGTLYASVFKMETNEETVSPNKKSKSTHIAYNVSNNNIAHVFLDWRNGDDDVYVNTWQYATSTQAGTYTSPIFDLKSPTSISRLSWSRATTTGQSVKMSYRAGSQSDLSDATWSDNTDTEAVTELTLSETNKRYFQYKATLEATTSIAYLYDVSIQYDGIATVNYEMVIPSATPPSILNPPLVATSSEETPPVKAPPVEAPPEEIPSPGKDEGATGDIQKPIIVPPTANKLTKPMSIGSAIGEVLILQERLQELGYLEGDLSGIFDSKTEQAVKDFQGAVGINPVGAVGPRTRAALNGEDFVTNKNYKFKDELSYNSRGEEVKELQTRLRDQAFFPYYVPSTGFFGPITQNSLISFQEFFNIGDALGTLSEKTRGFLNNFFN